MKSTGTNRRVGKQTPKCVFCTFSCQVKYAEVLKKGGKTIKIISADNHKGYKNMLISYDNYG